MPRQSIATCWYNYAGIILAFPGDKTMIGAGMSGRWRSLSEVVLRDVHFWIPVIVLLGGLAVLRWIS
jgi:hypothetical protein